MAFFRRPRASDRDAEEHPVEMNRATDDAAVAAAPRAEMQESSPSQSWHFRRPALFTRRRTGTEPEDNHDRTNRGEDDRSEREGAEDSPKTPRFSIAVPHLPGGRLNLPWTRNTEDSPRPTDDGTTFPNTHQSSANHEIVVTAHEPQMSTAGVGVGPGADIHQHMPMPMPARPQQAVTSMSPTPSRPNSSGSQSRRISGPDSEEDSLAEMADDGRQRRQRRPERRRLQREQGQEQGRRLWVGRMERIDPNAPPPKRFLFCFPWVASMRMRSLILQSFVSGILAAVLLGVYLALTTTGNLATREFSVLLILIILFGGGFFCHSLVRIFLQIHRPQADDEGNSPRGVRRVGGYAVPEEPIRVVMARDEEDLEQAVGSAADSNSVGDGGSGSGSGSNKPRPPPYGAWRQSVRVDPDRLFWQRNPEAPEPGSGGDRDGAEGTEYGPNGSGRSGSRAGARPPSYASEDGVDYVVEARPRSMAPEAMMTAGSPLQQLEEQPHGSPRRQQSSGVETVEAPLPVHPSEAGRWNGQHAPW